MSALLETTPPRILRARILQAGESLPYKGVRDRFQADAAMVNGHPSHEPSIQDVISLRAILRSVTDHFGVHSPRGVERGPDDRPMPPFNAMFDIHGYTDCFGDTETEARIGIEESGILRGLGVTAPRLDWKKVEPYSPHHIRGILTSVYFYERLKQQSNPYHNSQLIVLANAAPRDPANPSARGCPFVVAVLEGDVFYIGTLNGPGTELQGVLPYVKELWHTTLGVEKGGTEAGKKPKNVFRSIKLLPLFEQIVNGNGGANILDERMPLELIQPIVGIEVDSRDSLGNLKLSIHFKDLLDQYPFGTKVWLTIGDVKREAKIAQSHGDGGRDEVLIIPGSSPKHPCDEAVTRADVAINDGDAASAFIHEGESSQRRSKWAGRKVIIERAAD